MPFRSGCGCRAEISSGWTRNLYLLLDRLSKARSGGSEEAVISGIARERYAHIVPMSRFGTKLHWQAACAIFRSWGESGFAIGGAVSSAHDPYPKSRLLTDGRCHVAKYWGRKTYCTKPLPQ